MELGKVASFPTYSTDSVYVLVLNLGILGFFLVRNQNVESLDHSSFLVYYIVLLLGVLSAQVAH